MAAAATLQGGSPVAPTPQAAMTTPPPIVLQLHPPADPRGRAAPLSWFSWGFHVVARAFQVVIGLLAFLSCLCGFFLAFHALDSTVGEEGDGVHGRAEPPDHAAPRHAWLDQAAPPFSRTTRSDLASRFRHVVDGDYEEEGDRGAHGPRRITADILAAIFWRGGAARGEGRARASTSAHTLGAGASTPSFTGLDARVQRVEATVARLLRRAVPCIVFHGLDPRVVARTPWPRPSDVWDAKAAGDPVHNFPLVANGPWHGIMADMTTLPRVHVVNAGATTTLLSRVRRQLRAKDRLAILLQHTRDVTAAQRLLMMRLPGAPMLWVPGSLAVAGASVLADTFGARVVRAPFTSLLRAHVLGGGDRQFVP